MAGSKGRSGGTRKNSGRRMTNQTWGDRNKRESLQNFFQIIPVRSERESTQVNDEVPRPTAPKVPIAKDVQRDQLDNAYHNLPNHDAFYDFEEDEFVNKGKKIGSSRNQKLQQQFICTKNYYDSAKCKIVDFGKMWDFPPTFVTKTSRGLKDCWLDFFKLRIFNWIPEAVLGETWYPKCPNCNRKLARNGHSNKPRLVFDQHDNYWLNAPNKYICRNCEDENKACENDKDKKQCSFTSSCDIVMQQIKSVKPELYDCFPCEIYNRNAIDKKLLLLVVHSAVKGLGAAATAQNLATWHELEWQKKENQWAQYVSSKLNQPTINQQPLKRSDIEKCPLYFSKDMGGCVPASNWLSDTFNKSIQQNRKYYDSECIKRAKSTKILAIDASYKVPKWMMKWGGSAIYDALHSGTNEYNEIVMQRFSTSDNHEELGSNLEKLCNHGLNPYLCFSDDPGRDESLLKRCFQKLKNAIDDEIEIETIPENLEEITCNKQIMYLHRLDSALTALSTFIEDLEEQIADQASTSVKLSIDAGNSMICSNL